MKWYSPLAARVQGTLWPVLILLSALASAGVTFVGWWPPLRVLITLWFLAICPGMGLVRLLRLRDPLAELTLAVALSIAFATIVACSVLYAGFWSPPLILIILLAISIGGALVQLLRPRETRSEQGTQRGGAG